MKQFNRRDFLKLFAATGAAVTVSTALQGCASIGKASERSSVKFDHGVASGDPTSNAILLWTRAVPENSAEKQVTLGWELAADESFSNIIRSGTATTSASRDYTVKVDVTQLSPNQRYYYRFLGKNSKSPSGKTQTLPESGLRPLKFAVFSCSNYPAGYFNPYTEAAKDDSIDAVIHLGDYIYEYGAGGYATEGSQEIGRGLPENNSTELFTLTDYRRRYALYRTDEGLQALHAHAPFIAVWDDHEISNDTWKNGAENHQEDEGNFIERRAAAVQAYYEWLPIRPPQGEANLTIYRDFKFGDLVDLIMLDTRIIGRDKQLNYDDYRDAESGQFNTEKFQQDMSSDRSIMGKKQLQWLVNKLNNSSARWQVLGQQLLMGKMNFPAAAFAADDRSKVTPLLLQIAELKKRLQNGEELTAQQQAMVTQVTPYNLDAWDGYPIEREMLYRAAQKANKQLVVIAGDTHNAWHSELRSSDGAHIGVEFATSSVSSPGMEAYLSLDTKTAEQLARALPTLIEDLKYTNLHQRGYMNLFASEDAVEAEWVFVDTIRSKDYRVVNKHRVRYTGS